jgi:molybdate transport system substrate-binding protein
MMAFKRLTIVFSVMALASFAGIARAGTTNIAVAANFTDAAKEIASAFKAKSGHEAILSFGASGQIYTQIQQSAPYQVFLSADDERPKKLAEEGLAIQGSRFTYAIGKLVLWSKDQDLIKGEATLKANAFSRLSIANPSAAPYGAAAIEVLEALNLYGTIKTKIVMGNTIAQAFQFIETGNAEIGFVSLSQITGNKAGSRWMVPQSLYTPIRQDAILLKNGETDDASREFMSFLKGPEARAIIEKYGYVMDAKSGS